MSFPSVGCSHDPHVHWSSPEKEEHVFDVFSCEVVNKSRAEDKTSVAKPESSSVHKIILTLLATPVLCATIFFFYLSILGNNLIPGIYNESQYNVSITYPLDITPASWTPHIWFAVFLQQLFMIGYKLSTICRRVQGNYVYRTPGHIPTMVTLLYVLNLWLLICWTLAVDRHNSEVALGTIVGCFILTVVALIKSIRQLERCVPELVLANQRREIFATIVFVHNVLGSLAAWEAMTAVLAMGTFLQYTIDLSPDLAGSACLATVAGSLLVWMCVTHVVLKASTRYLFTPHLAIVAVLAGIVTRPAVFAALERNAIMAAALLGVAVLATVCKVAVAMCHKQSLYVEEEAAVQ